VTSLNGGDIIIMSVVEVKADLIRVNGEVSF
jgi:hypothetical protein